MHQYRSLPHYFGAIMWPADSNLGLNNCPSEVRIIRAPFRRIGYGLSAIRCQVFLGYRYQEQARHVSAGSLVGIEFASGVAP